MSAARETRTTTMTTIGMCVRALRIAAVLTATVLLQNPAAAAQSPSENGILLLAHGGSASWNKAVTDLTARVNERVPTEVAFGMATRQNIQAAIDRLTARGVKDVVAVPLFVSSHSSVITSTEYLLGLRDEAPKDLAVFAKMNHGQHGAAVPVANGTNGDAHAHHESMAVDGTTRVKTTARIRMTKALDDHRIVSDILASRARSISTSPDSEVAILVAHGPVPADDNARWLANMKVHAGRINEAVPFARVDYLTVRDDAPEAIKKAATEEFRGLVTKAAAENRRVLIVPLLLSYGGIEQGVRKRLDGLAYTIAAQALMPDDRLIDWVLESAAVQK